MFWNSYLLECGSLVSCSHCSQESQQGGRRWMFPSVTEMNQPCYFSLPSFLAPLLQCGIVVHVIVKCLDNTGCESCGMCLSLHTGGIPNCCLMVVGGCLKSLIAHIGAYMAITCQNYSALLLTCWNSKQQQQQHISSSIGISTDHTTTNISIRCHTSAAKVAAAAV